MIKQIKALILSLFALYGISYGQNTSYEHLDTLVSDYVKGLRIRNIDTICIYQNYFIGGFEEVKNDSDWCNYSYAYIPTYIFWQTGEKTFLSKKDNCFDYSVMEIRSLGFWKIYFANQNTIKKERVKPFQYQYLKNGKTLTAMVSVDHSGHQDFKIFIGNDTTEMTFDSFDLQQRNKGESNLNFEHNKNLKSKQLIDKIHEVVQEIEKQHLLVKTRR